MAKKNQKMSKAVVVYQPRTASAPKRNKNKKSKNRYKSDDHDLMTYKTALLDPFATNALGARVPDMFSVPTTTRHITRLLQVTTDSSGNFDVIIMPSALLQAVSTRGNLAVSGVGWTLGDGTTVSGGKSYITASAMSAQLRNYRIVGYGAKVSVVSSHDTTAGRVICATIPISSWVNDKDFTVGGQAPNSNNSSATMTNTLRAWGVPDSTSKVDLTGLPALANCVEVTGVRLADQPLQIVPKISSPEAFNFRQADDSPGGFQAVNQTSLSYISTGDASYMRLAGFEAIVVAGSGLPVSSQCLDIELIYHIEGIPTIINQAIGSGETAATLVSPVSWMSIVQQVAKTSAFKGVVAYGGDKILPGLGTLAAKYL